MSSSQDFLTLSLDAFSVHTFAVVSTANLEPSDDEFGIDTLLLDAAAGLSCIRSFLGALELGGGL